MRTGSAKLPYQRDDFASKLLIALPVIVMIVPQGVQEERSWILEGIFILFCALALLGVLARRCLIRHGSVVARRQVHPLLLLTLIYLGVLNPAWSLWQGNEWRIVFLTATPFMLMGMHYLYVMCQFDSRQALRLSRSFQAAGYLLASVIVANYFFSDLSDYDMRSAQIENDRNLALPLLPSAAVLALSNALTSTRAWPTFTRYLGTVLIVVAILMTVTRAMLVALILGATVTVLMLVRRAPKATKAVSIRHALAIICLCVVVALPFIPRFVERFSMKRMEDVQVISGRLDEYQAFFDLFLARPVFGAGLGHVATDPQATSYMLRTQGVARPHSHLFFLAGTTGIVGMVLYYSVLGSALLRLWDSSRTAGHDIHSLACIVGMVGAGIAGIVYTFTTTMYNTLSYNMFLGALIFLSRVPWKPT